MQSQRKKWYLLIVGSSLVVLCCVFGCIGVAKTLGGKNSTERLPIRGLSIELEVNQRDELFTQLREFSEEQHLKYDISFYENEKVFFVFMEGKGLEIIASPRPVTITEVRISFYEVDPTNPPSEEIIDELFGELKRFISEIPQATIIKEK